MPSEQAEIRLLLDEHYPAWLAEELTADGIDTVALNAHRPELRGVDDRRVLEAAVAEGRVVVTEDVNTFNAAIALIPQHVGVVYCHHARFPRTRPGLNKLRKALVALAGEPPEGLGEDPLVWWLSSSGETRG
jgi:predicted nuclease of predicted toxin-antitoxin system